MGIALSIMITSSAGFVGCYAMRDALIQNQNVVSFDFTPDLATIQEANLEKAKQNLYVLADYFLV
jgi:hypothetical protein